MSVPSAVMSPPATTRPLPDPSDPAPCPVPEPRRRGGGPRTPEGKAESRRNATTHGLRAEVVLPEDLAAGFAARTDDLLAIFRPETEHDQWLVRQVAMAEVRIDRCLALQLAELQTRITRAELCWEEDRRDAAEALGATLARDPARVARSLRSTRQGALWLLDRWVGLGEALDRAGVWDDPQRRLALDLLGVPAPLRDACPDLPDDAGPGTLRALVEREQRALQNAIDHYLDLLDEIDREQALEGLAPDSPASRRLQRYEAAFRRTLTWALEELRGITHDRRPATLWDILPPPPAAPAPSIPLPSAPPFEPLPEPEPRPEPNPKREPEPKPEPPISAAPPRPRRLLTIPLPPEPEALEPEALEPPAPGNRRDRRRQAKLARQAPRNPRPR